MCAAVESRRLERELTLPEIRHLAKTLQKLGVVFLILTGGEPFLRKDLVEIVEVFSSSGIKVRLQTNAMLVTEDKLQSLVAAGLEEVTISLDTLDSEKQDFINQCKGSWEKIIKGLSIFSQYLPVKGNMTGINTVISRFNIEEIPNIVKFVTQLGFYSSLIPVHIANSHETDVVVRRFAPDFAFRPEDHESIDKTYSKLIEMKRQSYHVHNSYRFLRESVDFLKHKRISWRCDSPDLYFAISPSGNFLPCVDVKTEVSMLDDNFAGVFASKSFRKLVREKVQTCPGCMYACWPEVSFFCRDYAVFVERIIQGIKISRFKRRVVAYDEMLDLAEQIRKEKW